MQKHKLNYDRAFERAKSKRRFVFPNSGFIAQLRLYNQMGYRIDTSNSRYKVFRLKLAADQIKKGNTVTKLCELEFPSIFFLHNSENITP